MEDNSDSAVRLSPWLTTVTQDTQRNASVLNYIKEQIALG